MASFVEAGKRKQLDDWRMMANVGYATGLIGSMALSKTRPRFKDIFNFPEDSNSMASDIEKSKAAMLAWAANVNRRSSRKKVRDNGE